MYSDDPEVKSRMPDKDQPGFELSIQEGPP